MDCPRHLNWWCCALLLAGAAAWPAAAQDVILSKPSDLTTEKANSFMGGEHKTSGDYNSSSSAFSPKPRADFDNLPGAPKFKPPTMEELKRWIKSNDDRKNWTLLTPQEILGVPSAEKIMGLPDPNQDGSRSAAERYLAREEQKQTMSATNAMRQSDSLWGSDDNPFQSQKKSKLDRRSDSFSQNPSDRRARGASALQPGTDQEQKTASLWHSAFNVIAPPPKPDLEQVAAMERFRALMEPPPVEKPPTLPGYSSVLAPAPAPKPDPYMQAMPSSYNPAGNSFTPVQNNISRPTGLTPLPTITGQTPNQPAPQPKPLTKPPPWLSNKPQPGQMPQREF